ncbi:hypothetical protein EU805_01695 [Salipiger sp. IMCC34102]|uniref:hypothetical protein n=1 Tax=Salipiger sp. IMCC34102 TaxID=2510647 RepID=UPI00101CFEBB|nr:hypothetical protein [Salipiger sp. IMCC34102]RYH04111.1 hypothetical protein EU805_01695 [Salipiger sp. IMCC34102]
MSGSRFTERRFGCVVLKLDAEGETCVLVIDRPGFRTNRYRYESIEEVVEGYARHRGGFDECSRSCASALEYAGKQMRQFRDPEAFR